MRDIEQNIRILNIQEVADILRVHRTTIYRYAKSGGLSSHQLGNRRLFEEEDVLVFFEKQVAHVYVFGKDD